MLLPPVNHDDHFTYLGPHFDFQVTDKQHKPELIKTFTEQMETIDSHSTQRMT